MLNLKMSRERVRNIIRDVLIFTVGTVLLAIYIGESLK